MSITAITAKSGVTLRRFACRMPFDSRACKFPEWKLSPQEQANFVKTFGHKYDTIVTFSPFIISDCDQIQILDSDNSIKKGDSANTIFVELGQESTVGDKSRETIASYDDPRELDRDLGDSIEKTLKLHQLLSK